MRKYKKKTSLTGMGNRVGKLRNYRKFKHILMPYIYMAVERAPGLTDLIMSVFLINTDHCYPVNFIKIIVFILISISHMDTSDTT